MKIIAIILLLAVLSSCYHQEAINTGHEGKPLPSFDLQLIDSSTVFNTQSIPSGKPVVMCFVGTHCPYSRAEIQDIVDNIDDFKDMRIYVFTIDPLSAMRGFYNHYQLNKYPNIIMGKDKADFFGKYFEIKGVPYTAIYTKDKKLVKAYTGKIDANFIKNIAME